MVTRNESSKNRTSSTNRNKASRRSKAKPAKKARAARRARLRRRANRAPALARSNFSVFRQICNLIPTHLLPKIVREAGAEKLSRTYCYWSHVVAMVYAQLTHCLGLNDLCDALRLRSGPLSALRGAKPPSRNNLSHANKVRPAKIAEELFWNVLAHLQGLSPGFAAGSRPDQRRLAHRFKCPIHIVDSTTIQLIAHCLDWAKHRRHKAAAKCHLRLDLHSMLPRFAIIDTAKHNDNKRARELCAAIRAAEIVIFDKAYVDFQHLADLLKRGVFWVTRAKDNMQCRVVKKRLRKPEGKILRDDEVILSVKASRQHYPERLRRVTALVEVDGQERELVFLTNNFTWAASSVADLYRSRWQIEVFFKQIKQTLKMSDFLGNSANAVRWQLWTALLAYVLLRFHAWVGQWEHSFLRLWAVIRTSLWDKLDLSSLVASYGTAKGSFRFLGMPEQTYLPGFAPSEAS